jgi:hypothetical protein
MEKISWADLGFDAAETAALDAFRRNDNALPLADELAAWRQWVVEIERGQLLILEELESACGMRDDLEESCKALTTLVRDRVYSFLDYLDVRYRDSTVPSGPVAMPPPPGRWWWGRIPIRNAARTFLYEDN